MFAVWSPGSVSLVVQTTHPVHMSGLGQHSYAVHGVHVEPLSTGEPVTINNNQNSVFLVTCFPLCDL